jgi:hypothetical protein
MTISTTVSFADLIAAVERELDDLRAQYDDAVALIEEEYDEDAMDAEMPDPADVDDQDMMQLAGLVRNVMLLDRQAQESQKRKHALEQFEDRYGGGEFELKSLTGQEVMDIETTIRLEANREGVDKSVFSAQRKQEIVDVAVTDAPDWFPSDDDSNPVASQAPQALMFALYEQAETLNSSGATDFTAPGFGETAFSSAESSATPSTSPPSPTPSAPTETDTTDSGED